MYCFVYVFVAYFCVYVFINVIGSIDILTIVNYTNKLFRTEDKVHNIVMQYLF